MVSDINNLINLFFITFIINFLTTFYSIYNFFNIEIFQKKQGMKLNMKRYALYTERKDKK